MEIREQKSPFEACGKDAVQEWLVHPVTIAMRMLLMQAVDENERQGLTILRNFPQTSMDDATCGSRVKNMGSVLAGLDHAVGIFDQARDYANGK